MSRISAPLVAVALLATTLAAAPPPPPPMPGGGQQAPQPYSPMAAPAATPSATPTTDPAMLARAKTVFSQLQQGKVDRSQLATGVNGNLTDATIVNAQSLIGKLGAPVSFIQDRAGTQGNVNFAIYTLTFEDGKKLDFLFAVDTQGKIEGLSLGTPH